MSKRSLRKCRCKDTQKEEPGRLYKGSLSICISAEKQRKEKGMASEQSITQAAIKANKAVIIAAREAENHVKNTRTLQ